MKQHAMILRQLVLAVGFTFVLAFTANAQRQSIELHSGWKFIRQDVPLTNATTGWEKVTVPHTWNAQDGQLGKVRNKKDKYGYYRGACWYEYRLDAPQKWGNKRVFIHFGAAALVADVYLNGHRLGEHRGGFTAFCYELTSYLHFGAPNDLRVRVDNSWQDDVPPLSGDFNIDGGLYRPVHLIVTGKLCITPLYYASPGVFLTMKSEDENSATVEVKSLVSNGSDAAAGVTIETDIKDARGTSVCSLSSEQQIGANKTEPVVQTLVVPWPHLWNGRNDPYLYTATVRVIHGGKTMDEVSQPLGLRTVAITQAQGFLLNGKPYPIHGVSLHQDYYNKGWALSRADHRQDMRIVLDMGATAIRLTHYPQSEYLHDLCDRNGLLLWNEVSLVNGIPDSRAFDSNSERQLREMILQRYNHPSAVFWGTFNEIGNDKKTANPDELLARLKEIIHKLDPTRIDVGASDQPNRSFNQIPTAICFNGYPGWYGHGTPDDMAKYIDDRYREVDKRIGISEYGAGGNPFQHEEDPPQKVEWKSQFHPEEYQSYVHEREWAIMKNNPKLWGTFAWVMFDFPSASRNEGGHPGLNDKGLVTQDRKIKKDAYYFYKANWNPEPMVYITSRRFTPRKLATTEVKVYSNCAEVELEVNGRSLGKQKPNEIKIVRWADVNLKPGNNTIKAIGESNGKIITDACEWILESNG